MPITKKMRKARIDLAKKEMPDALVVLYQAHLKQLRKNCPKCAEKKMNIRHLHSILACAMKIMDTSEEFWDLTYGVERAPALISILVILRKHYPCIYRGAAQYLTSLHKIPHHIREKGPQEMWLALMKEKGYTRSSLIKLKFLLDKEETLSLFRIMENKMNTLCNIGKKSKKNGNKKETRNKNQTGSGRRRNTRK